VARVVLGIMLGMALIGLGYALYTQSFRRANDTKLPPGAGVPAARPGPGGKSGDLAGLGYLPADCVVVAGIRLAEVLRDPEGQKLWTKLRGGPAGMVVDLLESKTGLHAEEIDHLALGLSPGDGQPRLIVVVRTRSPYGSEALARALEPLKPQRYRGRSVYRFALASFGDGLLLRLSEDTLVLSLGILPAQLKVLDAIPSKEREGAEGLPASVRDLLQNKLEHGSLIWAAGSLTDVPGLPDLLRLVGVGRGELGAALLNLERFTVGIRLGPQLTLGAALQAPDEPAGQKLAVLLKQQQPQGIESFKVIGPDAGPAAQGGGFWVLVQVRATAAGAAGLIDRLTALDPQQGQR
jgi:hypothetical protein